MVRMKKSKIAAQNYAISYYTSWYFVSNTDRSTTNSRTNDLFRKEEEGPRSREHWTGCCSLSSSGIYGPCRCVVTQDGKAWVDCKYGVPQQNSKHTAMFIGGTCF